MKSCYLSSQQFSESSLYKLLRSSTQLIVHNNCPWRASLGWRGDLEHHKRTIRSATWLGSPFDPPWHSPWYLWSFENQFGPLYRKIYLGCMQVAMNGLSVQFLEVLDLRWWLVRSLSFLPSINNYISLIIPYLMGSGSSTTFLP